MFSKLYSLTFSWLFGILWAVYGEEPEHYNPEQSRMERKKDEIH